MTRNAARLLFLLAPSLMAGCVRSPHKAIPQPRYVVGPAYQAGAVWFYPREDFHLDATGLAVVLPDRTGLTADGEAWDSLAMAGAHATLQLPAIVRVTNLETGLQVLIQINDRGPGSPGRLIGLTRRAADRLGVSPGAAAVRVRMQVEDGPSQSLRDLLQGGSRLAVASAPRETVSAEILAALPGLERSTRGRSAPVILPIAASGTPDVALPVNLPDAASRVPAKPGRLWIRGGDFGQAGYANQVRARLNAPGATVERVRQGGTDTFRVRAGPFDDVGRADLALDRALQAGVTDARIVVE